MDLFQDEVITSSGCLAQDTICNLVTLVSLLSLVLSQAIRFTLRHQVYQAMICEMQDNNNSVGDYQSHSIMNNTIALAIGLMYEQPNLFPQFTQAVIRLPFITSVLYFICCYKIILLVVIYTQGCKCASHQWQNTKSKVYQGEQATQKHARRSAYCRSSCQ
jgi:hypothetical protein